MIDLRLSGMAVMDSLTLEDLSLNIMVENDSMAISLDTPGVLPNSLDVLGQNITEDIDSIARLPLRPLGCSISLSGLAFSGARLRLSGRILTENYGDARFHLFGRKWIESLSCR